MSTGAWRLVELVFVFSLLLKTWKTWSTSAGKLLLQFYLSVICHVCGCIWTHARVCMLQSKPLNVEYLMMDASVLLPPTGTPLTGIDFVKRLPCGDVEKTRRVCPLTDLNSGLTCHDRLSDSCRIRYCRFFFLWTVWGVMKLKNRSYFLLLCCIVLPFYTTALLTCDERHNVFTVSNTDKNADFGFLKHSRSFILFNGLL